MVPMTALRGGAMGIVSGIKGGCLPGALGGMARMVASSIGVGEWSIMLYMALMGLVLGMMAGAVIGAAYGFTSGLLSGRWPAHTAVWWWGMALPGGTFLGGRMVPTQPWLGAAVGLLLALLAPPLSLRDFRHILAQQTDTSQN